MRDNVCWWVLFFFSSRRRHTICALVTGVQTCALPISLLRQARPNSLLRRARHESALTRLLDRSQMLDGSCGDQMPGAKDDCFEAIWLIGDRAIIALRAE